MRTNEEISEIISQLNSLVSIKAERKFRNQHEESVSFMNWRESNRWRQIHKICKDSSSDPESYINGVILGRLETLEWFFGADTDLINI
jgi:hypothetical protein